MSYQVIARKWRPQTFQQLIGQEHVTQTLLNALKNKRLPHAFLFTGVRGVGKTSAARILAKSLKCPQGPTPCNECSVCKEIAGGSHVDVMEIDGASHTGVDGIREIIDKVGYLPMQGQYKVCIIDEVHMLSTSAFNALLKTLEEPPAHIKFVFATTEVQKIPRTILSRCQKFHFRQIPTKMIYQHLQKICQTDQVQADTQALWHIARQAEGSMRDGQSLLDQTITFTNGSITLQKVIDLLGLTDHQLILDTVKALLEHDASQILHIVSQLYTSSCDLKAFIHGLMDAFKSLLFIKEASDSEISNFIDLPDADIAVLKQLAESTTKENIHALFDMAFKGSLDMAKAQDYRIVLEMLLLKMAHSSQRIKTTPQQKTSPVMFDQQNKTQPSAQVHRSTQNPPLSSERVIPVQAHSVPASTPHSAASSTVQGGGEPYKPVGGITPQELKDFILKIKEDNPLLAAALDHLFLEKISGNTITLSLPLERSFLLSKLQSRQTLMDIKEHAKAFWKRDLDFQFHIAQKKNTQTTELRVKKTDKDLIEDIKKLPEIQKLQSVLGAKVESVVESDVKDK